MNSKKMKAAIAAVLYYLKEKESEKGNKNNNQWAKSGRQIIMRNRKLVQTRGIKRYIFLIKIG